MADFMTQLLRSAVSSPAVMSRTQTDEQKKARLAELENKCYLEGDQEACMEADRLRQEMMTKDEPLSPGATSQSTVGAPPTKPGITTPGVNPRTWKTMYG